MIEMRKTANLTDISNCGRCDIKIANLPGFLCVPIAVR
jgi:hypothetical protein